jgi:hypothetical protein
MRSNEFNSMLFGLTDQSVEFRNKWRNRARMVVWFALSLFSMTVMIPASGTKDLKHIAVIIGMSLLKYIPLLGVVYSLARMMAARYLDDVYELNDEDLASDFLEEVTFGYGHEQITVNEGKISERDEKSPLILIGGPGYIQVNLDSIALLEKVNGEPEVIHPQNGSWKLGRFERIREIGKYDEAGKREYAIINLRDQFVNGLSVRSRTKDGIPIEAQGIKVMFSILRRKQTEEDKLQGDAYLFDERAVQALVYDQTIITRGPAIPHGITFPWDTTVIPLVISELEELITSHTLSEILASISQKEIDSASTNEQTIEQMRVEMTGKQTAVGKQTAEDTPNKSSAPSFKSRSMIIAQFFDSKFKEKAAKLGISVEWIDIGTWQFPTTLILDKHKEAWGLARDNAKKRSAIERYKKRREMTEILKLIDTVIIKNYEKNITSHKPKDTAAIIAREMLKTFRKEIRAAQMLIENDSRPREEKQIELANIDKALHNISHLIDHYL